MDFSGFSETFCLIPGFLVKVSHMLSPLFPSFTAPSNWFIARECLWVEQNIWSFESFLNPFVEEGEECHLVSWRSCPEHKPIWKTLSGNRFRWNLLTRRDEDQIQNQDESHEIFHLLAGMNKRAQTEKRYRSEIVWERKDLEARKCELLCAKQKAPLLCEGSSLVLTFVFLSSYIIVHVAFTSSAKD